MGTVIDWAGSFDGIYARRRDFGFAHIDRPQGGHAQAHLLDHDRPGRMLCGREGFPLMAVSINQICVICERIDRNRNH